MEAITKKYFEIFLVIFVLFIIIHSILYIYYFDGLCNKYSGTKQKDYQKTVITLSKCRDSIICEPKNMDINSNGRESSWTCDKKNSGLIHINIFNNFKNSIIN